MKKKKISNLFFNGGCLLEGENKKLLNTKKEEVVELFEKYGVLIFRNFSHSIKNITKFTDMYTHIYANDALRRKTRLENKKIKNVDIGLHKVDLHSEASFSPSWPEIIWFACILPSQKNSGNTILCDGIKLWEDLSFKAKKFFLSNQIRYELKIPYGKPKPGKGIKDWYLDYPGVESCKLNISKGLIEFNFHRYAVIKSRIPNKLAFANHLIVTLESEDQLYSRLTDKMKTIPKDIIKEVNEKSSKLTFHFEWKSGDILMIDNKRFLHGRDEILKNDKRDIVNIQSLKSNFGFGNYTIND